MRFTISATVLAFANAVYAQTAGFDAISAPTDGEVIPVGTTYAIVWAPGSVTGTVTVDVLGGTATDTLQLLETVGDSIDNTLGTVDWTVKASQAGLATYGIRITLDSNTTTLQYSFPFHVSGGSDDSSSSTASSSSYPTTVVDTTSASTSASASATVTSTSSVYEQSTTTTVADYPTTTPAGNGTAIATTNTGAATTLTSATTVKSSSTSSAATTSSTVVSTNGAPRAAAGSIALVAGIAAAIFTL